MPVYAYGDMWTAYRHADLFCITTNADVNRRGELVMGRGAALELKNKYPNLPVVFGKLVSGRTKPYHLLIHNDSKFALFQVKHHWHERADVDLIRKSTRCLRSYALNNPTKQIHINFPGIGNGGLSISSVLPIVSQLPNNVTIWQYKDSTMSKKVIKQINELLAVYKKNMGKRAKPGAKKPANKEQLAAAFACSKSVAHAAALFVQNILPSHVGARPLSGVWLNTALGSKLDGTVAGVFANEVATFTANTTSDMLSPQRLWPTAKFPPADKKWQARFDGVNFKAEDKHMNAGIVASFDKKQGALLHVISKKAALATELKNMKGGKKSRGEEE